MTLQAKRDPPVDLKTSAETAVSCLPLIAAAYSVHGHAVRLVTIASHVDWPSRQVERGNFVAAIFYLVGLMGPAATRS